MTKILTPRKLSLVKPSKHAIKYELFPPSARFLFLGEIPNMPGHCAVVIVDSFSSLGKRYNAGETHVGYHIEDFIELTEEEV